MAIPEERGKRKEERVAALVRPCIDAKGPRMALFPLSSFISSRVLPSITAPL